MVLYSNRLFFRQDIKLISVNTMAKGKGKGKKKAGGGGGNKKKNKGAPQGANNNATSSSNSGEIPASVLKGTIPDFSGVDQSNINANYSSLYKRYKLATQRFINYMRVNTPDSVVDSKQKDIISFLLTAADWMAESRHVLDPVVWKDLKMSIRVRSRVSKSIFGGGNLGHKVS